MKPLIGVFLIVVAAFFIYKKNKPEVITYDGMIDDNLFVLSHSDSRFQYELSDEPLKLDAVAAMTGKNSGIKEGGALLTVHLLSHKSADKFAKTYGRTGQCPAPFFNKHADQKFLIAANTLIEGQLNNWDLPDYRSSRTWEDFTIHGRCITSLKDGKLNGEPVVIHSSFLAPQ